jgi:5-methylcytosine-specific restriction endonuclease McrA
VTAPTRCERCSDPLPPRQPGDKKYRRFCSTRCKNGCYKTRTFTCQHCGGSWDAWSKPGQPPRYCSEDCRKRAAVVRAASWQKANPERLVEHKKRSNANYYAANRDEQRARTARYKRENPQRVQAWHATRHAKRRGAEVGESFTLDEIFERDQGWCYLCRSDCSRADATMEHVVPIGPPHFGPHSRANVKLAHRSCNTRKGTKLLSELPWYVSLEGAA